MDDDYFMCSTWHSVDVNEELVFMTDWFSCALKKRGTKRMLSRSLTLIRSKLLSSDQQVWFCFSWLKENLI